MNNIITTNSETITSMEVTQIEKINETKIGQSKIDFTDFSLNLHMLLHRIKYSLVTISLTKVSNL